MAFRRKHSDKRHEELVKENEKLRRDVAELEDAYFLHQQIHDEQDKSVHGILRKEIGGSIWRHGGEGKVQTYKSSKDLEDVSNEKPHKGGKSSRPNSSVNKIKKDGEDKADKFRDDHHGKGNIDLVVESSHMYPGCELSHDQIKDLSKNGKEQKSSTVNTQECSKFAHKKDVKQSVHAEEEPILAFETRSVKPETLSALKIKVLQKVSSKVIQRPSVMKLSQNEKVLKTVTKYDKSKVTNQSSEKNSQSSQNRLKPNIRVERTKTANGGTRKDRNVTESVHITPAFRKSESPEKFPESSFFDFQKTNIPDEENIFDVEEELEEKSSLHHQSTDNKTVDEELYDLNEEIKDTENLNTRYDDGDDARQFQITPQHGQTSNKICDLRVENWLRDLVLVDAEKYIQIFADNEIDMAELELLTSVELHEMGVLAVGALNKIVRGIKKLRGEQVGDVHEAECLNQVTKTSVGKDETYMELQYKSLKDSHPARDSCYAEILTISDEESSSLTDNDPLSFARQTSVEDHKNTLSRVSDRSDSSQSRDSRTSLKIENGTVPSSVKSVLTKSKSRESRSAKKGHNSVLKAKLNVRQSRPKSGTVKGKDIARPKSAPLKGKDIARIDSSKNLKREKREDKSKHTSKRCRSQSLESVQRKAVEDLKAATKKFEEQQEREKEEEIQRKKMVEHKKSRRDKMAFRHQLREQEIKMKQIKRISPSPEGLRNEEVEEEVVDLPADLENLITVNILSHKDSGENGRSSSLERVSVSGSRSNQRSPIRSRRLQQERSRTEGSRKSLILKSTMLEIARDGLGSSLLTTQKITNKGNNSSADMIRNARDKTHIDRDHVADIKQQIENLKTAVNADDKETLLLIKELQRRLNDLESQIKVKEEALPVKARASVHEMKFNIKADDKSDTKGPKGKSVSKRELLEEMRKEKDQHRQQIRYLQSELRRLQYADPVRTLELQFSDLQYSEQDIIGSGTFADVYRGLYQGSEVAVKRLKVPLPDHDRNYFAAEVSLLRELHHPRVVLLLGVCTTDRLPLMVLEFMSQGSLFKLLHDPERPGLDHAEFHQIARDIAQGMNYLHNHKPEVLHLDLKSLNVLLSQGFRAKIADFGFSKLRHEADRKVTQKTKPVKPAHGSFLWMAPELLDKGEITPKADVYSFGMILWEMFTRKLPYENCSVFQILENIRKNRRPDIPASCTKGLRHLMERCWSPNQAVRPPFKDIISELENLAFPPAWRDLFQEAGIPQEALENLQSARTIISLVNSSLGAPEWLPPSVSDVPMDALSLRQVRSGEETLSSSEDSLARVSIITSSVSSQSQSEEDLSDNNSISNESSDTFEGEYSSDDCNDTDDKDDRDDEEKEIEDDLSDSSSKQQSSRSSNNGIFSKSDAKMKSEWRNFDKDSFFSDDKSRHKIAGSNTDIDDILGKLHPNSNAIKSSRSDTTKVSVTQSIKDEKEVTNLINKKGTSPKSFQDSNLLHSPANKKSLNSSNMSVHSVVDKNTRGEGSSRVKKSEDDVQQWLTYRTTSLDSFHDLDVTRSRRTNVYVSSSTNLRSNVRPAREIEESPRIAHIQDNSFREATKATTDSFYKPLTFDHSEPFTFDPVSHSGSINLTKEINPKQENNTVKNAPKSSKEENITVNENKNLQSTVSSGVKQKKVPSWEDMLWSGEKLVSPTKKIMSSVRSQTSAIGEKGVTVDRSDVTPSEQIASPHIRSLSSCEDLAESTRERDLPSKGLVSDESSRIPGNNKTFLDDLKVPISGRSSRETSRGKASLKLNDCSTEIFGPPDLLENRKSLRKLTKKESEKNEEVPLSRNVHMFKEEESIYGTSEDVLKLSQTKDDSAFQETNIRENTSGGISNNPISSQTKKDTKYEKIYVRESTADSLSSIVFEKLKLDNENLVGSSVRSSAASWMTPKESYSHSESTVTWMSPRLVNAGPQNAVKESDTVFPLSPDLISTSPRASCMTRDSLETSSQDFESETVTPRLGIHNIRENKYFSPRDLKNSESLHGLHLESSEKEISGTHSSRSTPKLTVIPVASDSPRSGRQASGRKEKIRLIHAAVRNSFEAWNNKDGKNKSVAVATNPILALKLGSNAKSDREFRDSLEIEEQVMEEEDKDIEKKSLRTFTTPLPPPPPPPPPPLPLSSQDISDSRKSFSILSVVNKSSVLGDKPPFVKMNKEEVLKEDASRRKPLHPRSSSGLPPFLVQSVELRTQKEQLRSISKPHPSQLQDLSLVSKETISSIAEILKMAMLDRRIAMGEDPCSVTQSVDSAWSVGPED